MANKLLFVDDKKVNESEHNVIEFCMCIVFRVDDGDVLTWHFELNCHDICNHLEWIYDFLHLDRSITIALISFVHGFSSDMYAMHSLCKQNKPI